MRETGLSGCFYGNKTAGNRAGACIYTQFGFAVYPPSNRMDSLLLPGGLSEARVGFMFWRLERSIDSPGSCPIPFPRTGATIQFISILWAFNGAETGGYRRPLGAKIEALTGLCYSHRCSQNTTRLPFADGRKHGCGLDIVIVALCDCR